MHVFSSRYGFLAALTLLAFLASGMSSPPADAAEPFMTDGFEPTRSVVFKTTEQAELKLHLFEPAGNTDAARPAVVFFFGGDWNGGTPRQFYRQAQYLAKRGIVAIAAEYRTKKENGTTPFQCVEDALTAMRFTRQHAAAWGIDPERIAAAGGSAGGQLAMATATVTADWLDTDSPELKKTSPRPDALILFNPVYDNGPGQYGYDRVGDKYLDFSPAHNLTADLPPTLVMLGDRDKHVPVSIAESVRDQMVALGVRSELIIYPGQPHGFFNLRSEKNRKMYDKSVRAMDDFLVSLGWLEPR